MSSQQNPLLRSKEAAELLAISTRKLWELTNRGEIPRVKIGKAVRYDLVDLVAWIAQQKERRHGH